MIRLFSILFLLMFSMSPAQQSNVDRQISEITAQKKATVAVSVIGIDFPFELNNENADRKLPLMSVFKFHTALTVLHFVDKGKLRLDQSFFIKKEELLTNTYSPLRDKKPDGNFQLTLDELLFYSVALSDNNTTDILLRILGGPKTVQQFMDENRVKNTYIQYDEEEMHRNPKYFYGNYGSVKSLSNLYKSFYNGNILSKKSTEYLYRILQQTTTGGTKLVQQLPPNTVAHKTGSSGKNQNGLTVAENDSGIVTLPNGHHYAISVFVNDSYESETVNCQMISDISKAVFDSLNK